MRRLETAVRDQKSIREASKSSGDKFLSGKCTAKIKAYQKKYNRISEITGIAPQPKRMSITKGLNTVKNVDFSGNGGIMKLSAKTGAKFNDNKSIKVDFESVEREKKRIKTRLEISNVNLDELKNTDILTEFLDETEKLQLKFGKKYSGIVVSSNLKGTQTICEVNPSMILCLNPDYFNDRNLLTETLNFMSSRKIIPKDCANIEYISKHEFYHMYTKLDIDQPASKASVLYLRENKKNFKGIICRNATVDPYEFVADYLSAPQSNKIKSELLTYYNLEET